MCLFSGTFAFSQNAISDSLTVDNKHTNSENIISYREKVAVGLTYSDASNSFFLKDRNNGTENDTRFTPNTQQQFIIGLNYKLLGIGFGFTPSFLRTDKGDYKSHQFNLKLNGNYKQWFQSLAFVSQKGFFVENDQTGRVYNPHLQTLKIGGTTSYIFNEDFSYRMILDQSQWQRHSTGSFVPTFSFFYTNADFNDDQRPIVKANFYTFTIAPAYYYNFVLYEHLLASVGVMVGGGVNIVNGNADPLTELSYHLKLGYNTDRFFSFVGFDITQFSQFRKDKQLNDRYTHLKIGIGYRFLPPQKAKNIYDKATKSIGL